MNSFTQIYEVVKQIPFGKVATYGQVALMAGNPRWSRVVGYALHAAPEGLPCHRVVNRLGELSPAFLTVEGNRQRVLLEREGVAFRDDGSVDLKACLWRPELL